MPLQNCTTKEGKSGWKWGDSGHCYRDKKMALKQGVAIEKDKQRRGEKSYFDAQEGILLELAVDHSEHEEDDDLDKEVKRCMMKM